MLVTQKIIVLNKEGKILALRRSKTDPSKPLSWDLPGGLLEDGENLRDAVVREITEETGISVEKPELIDAFDYINGQNKYLICIGYKTNAITTDINLSYEHDMYEWISKEEFLMRDTKGHIRQLLEKFN